MTAKQLEALKYRDAHLDQVHVSKSSKSFFLPDQDYYVVYTSLDRKCPNEFPRCQDREDSKDFSVCSDWDTDLEEQDRQKQELENKKPKKQKHL